MATTVTLFSFIRSSEMGSYVEQFEAPEEVNRPQLECLQKWTEKRLDTVVLNIQGNDRDLYRLLCESCSVYSIIHAALTANYATGLNTCCRIFS